MTLRNVLIAFLISVLSGMIPTICFAQDDDTADIEKIEVKPSRDKKFYMSNGLDAAILSSSIITRPGRLNEPSTLRFSYILNFGFNFNYDFNNNIGLYTGIGIKNIGFIDKVSDSTIKRRVYTIGVPLGIKLGNINRRNYLYLGGGIDIPFNYKEKAFVKRGNKEKFNEWFSNRTPLIMPYIFAGISLNPGISFKLQYYTGNFMNTGFTEYPGTSVIAVHPYAGYKVNLMLLSIGFDIHYTQKGKPKSVLITKNETPSYDRLAFR